MVGEQSLTACGITFLVNCVIIAVNFVIHKVTRPLTFGPSFLTGLQSDILRYLSDFNCSLVQIYCAWIPPMIVFHVS